jgi:hypothetical protein
LSSLAVRMNARCRSCQPNSYKKGINSWANRIKKGMPDLNGYELAERIRHEAWGKTMALVALTGWGQESRHGPR